MYVCVYVRHAQKIASLFFSVQFPFKLNILFTKKYINLLGPKTLRIYIHTESSSVTLIEELTRRLEQLESSPSSTAGAADKRSFYNGSPTAGTGAGAAVLGLNTQVTEAESYDSMDSVGSGRRRR